MAVAIEIRRTSQPPTGRKCGTEHAANKNVIVQIPDCCLTRRRIADHKVPMAVAVKVSYYSRTCAGRWCWCRILYILDRGIISISAEAEANSRHIDIA